MALGCELGSCFPGTGCTCWVRLPVVSRPADSSRARRPVLPLLVQHATVHGHPEFDAFLESLDDVALACDYRTDDLSERLRQKAIDESRALFRREPEPAPSGREVVDSIHSSFAGPREPEPAPAGREGGDASQAAGEGARQKKWLDESPRGSEEDRTAKPSPRK